jgi:lipopolysaccharide export system permease protein
MKLNAVVHRFIFMELLIPFLVSVMFLLFVFLMTTMLKIAKLIVNYHVSLDIVGRMILYSIPAFLEYIIPMATMIAVLLTFLKMSNDNEIIALKSGGISLYALTPAVFLFCTLTFLTTCFMTVYGIPMGKLGIKELLFKLKSSSYSALLQERAFNDKFKGIMIYVSKTDPQTNTLIDVFMEDRSNRKAVVTVMAPRGQLIDQPDGKALHLRLFDGCISQVQQKDKSSHVIRFKTYDVRLDLKGAYRAIGSGAKYEDEMSVGQLLHYIAIHAADKSGRYYPMLIELHKKFSLPFSCFALGILAIPLGIRSRFSKQSFGIALGLISFLVYYLLLSAEQVFGESGMYPPAIGMWLPNVLFGGLGFYLLFRAANERPMLLSGLIDRLSARRSDREEGTVNGEP